MLQRHLPRLRPAPVVALTATATPVVQNDVAQQLGLAKPLRSIQGFRRKNIGIEIVEIARSGRAAAVLNILRDRGRRPAIVYVPTRSESDTLTAEIRGPFRVEPYHAGLRADRRQLVQERFLNGELDVIVATIAFGMGIDKADVRTVIHTALPGSLEAYYQEIGRAGRDGNPSRAILMHSYADRRRHDFFFTRDYPEAEVLDGIFQTLGAVPVSREQLERTVKLDPDLFEKAIDKLWVHGGALLDPEENITRGHDRWRDSYLSHSEQRSGQVEFMLRYAAGDQCRMAALVRYFGDRTDTQVCCGMCDFCAPDQCIAQAYREATAGENRVAFQVISALGDLRSRASGRLHAEICPGGELDRDGFEQVLAAMARAGLLLFEQAVFEKDGKKIPYRTVRLTQDGEEVDLSTPLGLTLRQSGIEARPRKTTRGARKETPQPAPLDIEDAKLAQALKDWRLREAKSRNLPAFRVFTDKILRQIVEERPLAEEDLLAISGLAPGFTKRYGPEILTVVRAFEP